MNWLVKYKVCGVMYLKESVEARGPLEVFDVYKNFDTEEEAEEWVKQTIDENSKHDYDEFVIVKVLKKS